MSSSPAEKSYKTDPILMAILANRLNAIVGEMTNTLLRTARSAVLAVVRDFSCSLVTADNRLLAPGEGVPVHIFGSSLQTTSLYEMHPNLKEGDAFLHNDVYMGNTHAADHMYMVPVFIDGEHMFTACAKAHQADCGNSIPSTYHAYAKDVYEEGALIFPCVKVQENYEDVDDIIRMCRRRIRVPDQWYGDYLATVGAARIGERRLKELVDRYGREEIRQFIEDWFAYSEKMMIEAIKKLPSGTVTRTTVYDPMEPTLPNGLPINVSVEIDPKNAKIEVDLTKNEDSKEFGLNESVACATSNALCGVFNCIDSDVPHNAGSFKRVSVKLREGCVTGIPEFPLSCSMATTNIGDRIVNATQAAFAEFGKGYGLAEGSMGMGIGAAVISGKDERFGGAPYINQEWLVVNGGPGTPTSDGWLNYGLPVAAGLMYRGSVEVEESKHPILIKHMRVIPGGGGAGEFRGAPGADVMYGPRFDPMTVVTMCDAHINPPQGVQGGHSGPPAQTYKIKACGTREKLPGVAECELQPGEWIQGFDAGGGGYGDPLDRDPDRVLKDVQQRWETLERATDVYGVIIKSDQDALSVDVDATGEERTRRRNQ